MLPEISYYQLKAVGLPDGFFRVASLTSLLTEVTISNRYPFARVIGSPLLTLKFELHN
uniref:Uncharacterized protein n=1 Tax=Octopus bimaculoides TaxID=37653 RepID=A0A0L8FRF5_OCTBM